MVRAVEALADALIAAGEARAATEAEVALAEPGVRDLG